MRGTRLLAACLILLGLEASPAWGQLVASVLPASRSVSVNSPVPATAFAAVINTAPATALGCTIAPVTVVPATFSYQPTDPLTNLPIGIPNAPVSIAPGGLQTFVIAFSPFAAFGPTDVQIGFACSGMTPAVVIPGVNTLLLSASSVPVPDMVALAATTSNNGIVTITVGSAAAFAVATVNVGAAGTVSVSADTGGVALPLSIVVCRTVPATGQCVGTIGSSVSTFADQGSTPTFGIFVGAHGVVPFVPEANRVFVRIRDDGGVTRGSTSVAIRTQAPSIGGTYTGGGQYTQADCANPANDASLGIQASVDVDDLGGGAFAGEVDITFPVVSGLRVRATVTGSLSPSAQVGGSLAFSSLVNGQVVSSGTGTFTGQLSGDALAVSFEGQVLSGETCRVSGFLAVNR